MLCALRGVIREADDLQLIEPATAARILKKLTGVKHSHAAEFGRMITEAEKKALLTACRADNTPAGRRDAALIAVLAVCVTPPVMS